MSGKISSIRWLWIIVGAIIGAVVFMALTMVSNVGYGVVIGFQMRGAPPPDVLVDAISSMPYALLSFVWAFLGGLIGGRLGARRSAGAAQLAGLLIGIITAILIALILRDFSWWGLTNVVIAFVGGWAGGLLAGRNQEMGNTTE